MTAKVYLQRIKNAFNTIRHKYPNITDDMLLDDGVIYYHNTSKSTEDCYQEDRVLPPFEICYAGGEPFISMRIHSDGSVKFHRICDRIPHPLRVRRNVAPSFV